MLKSTLSEGELLRWSLPGEARHLGLPQDEGVVALGVGRASLFLGEYVPDGDAACSLSRGGARSDQRPRLGLQCAQSGGARYRVLA
jgi:hypothetical protein